MNDKRQWEELIDRQLRGELNESEKERLAEWLDSDAEARAQYVEYAHWDTRLAEALRQDREPSVDAGQTVGAEVEPPKRSATPSTGPTTPLLTKGLLGVAALTIVALAAGLYFQWASSERRMVEIAERAGGEVKIARITGLSGSLVWIGDGGQIARELSVGDDLSGGTIEGTAPDSWFELEFKDGSTVMVSATSMLTFSDHGQKKLHLKEGMLSASVKRQLPGKPMLLHTRTAMVEVLGTQFKADADLFSVTLDVNEGQVRVQRLSDGKQIDVAAGYRVVAAPDQEMALTPLPDSVNQWKSRLDLGEGRSLGKWSPGADGHGALGAVPFTTASGKTIYTAAMGVSHGDNPPVVLQPDARIRVRGRIMSTHEVYFGITVRQANGDFAGKFQTIRLAEEFPSGEDFEVELRLSDYRLDPSLKKMASRLPSEPFGLVLESVWCHTLYDPAGLVIYEVEVTR